jgi:hypothetical protein
VPSEGNSGGIITFWKSSRFIGQMVFQNKFALSTEFTSTMSGARWLLTNVYAPCSPNGRQDFLNWMNDIDMPVDTNWLLVGDFNLLRRLSDRNKDGGNIHDMLSFNATLSNLRLEELKLFGNKYTWTNKQESPLLERLDWFFASCTWIAQYPGSFVKTLSRDISDHSPCLVSVSTGIPKAKSFRFENYWMLHKDFMQIMEHGWSLPNNQTDKAKVLRYKFKNLRRVLRQWQGQISNLAKIIEDNKLMISFLDYLEEFRDLALEEWNFRLLVQ